MAEQTPDIRGKAAIVRGFYEQQQMDGLWAALAARLATDPADAGALMDRSIMLQVMGQPEAARASQQAALAQSRTFRIRNGDGSGLTVLAFVAAGNFMANTPVEFLLETSNITLLLHFVDEAAMRPPAVPPHDVAFVAVSQYDTTDPALARLEILLRQWPQPVINRDAAAIAAMTRDGIAGLFAGSRLVHAPVTAVVARHEVEALQAGTLALTALLPQQAYPVIIRPHGTHAGQGLEKIMGPGELPTYLARHMGVERFYLAPFVDYQDGRGRFRKARVAVIDGQPFASHLAVSAHWMVHYLNADMTEHADRRAEEAQWMASFDSGFAQRHALAIAEMSARLKLDYFVIDCAERENGGLLLFEADTGMIVHSMDPAAMFAYKGPAMAKLFAAFAQSLQRRVAAGEGVPPFMPVTHRVPRDGR